MAKMRIPALIFVLVALLLALPVVVWLYVPGPMPVYAQTISITLTDAGDEGIIFGEVDPGSENVGDVSQNANTPAVGVWVGSETAVSVNISIRGTTTDTIPLNKWKYSTTFDGTKYSINSTYDVVYSGVSSNNTYAFYHWVDVPEDTLPGSYNCTISYKAVALP